MQRTFGTQYFSNSGAISPLRFQKSFELNPRDMMSSFGEMSLTYADREIYSEDFKFFHKFNFKDDDVVAVTYPKSGTNWMQHLLPLVVNGGDLTPVQTTLSWERAPWLEVQKLAPFVDQLASPRVLVTHFLYNLMPSSFYTSKAKVIYVMRDPRDILVSSYYFHQRVDFLEDPGTFDEFIDKFLKGRVLYGKWTDHMKSWRRAELGGRILYITYEEMVQDLLASIRCISDFLCCNLSEEVIQKIAEWSSFNSMKTNTMSNYSLVPAKFLDSKKAPVLRKGTAGDWKNHFSSEQMTQFTSVINKELEGENISLPWRLDE